MLKQALPFLAAASSTFAADPCAPEAPHCYTQDDCERCYCLGPAQIIANSPVRPYTCDGDIAITVAGLYWQAHQDGLEYAVNNAVFTTAVPSSSTGNLSALGNLHNLIDSYYEAPKFQWNFGFKIGLGYNSACDGWDIGMMWTRYEGRAKSHIEAEADDNHTLIPLWSAFTGFWNDFFFAATDIETDWNLDFNLIDIDLGRQFWVSKYLTFRPHIGLRYASIHQNFHLYHKGGSWNLHELLGPALNQPAFNGEVQLKNNFDGIGPILGSDTNWHLGCGWSLYGDLSAALVYGRFDIDHDENYRLAEAPFTKTRVLETEDHFRASRAIMDLALGVQWMGMICDCKYGLLVSLGWEQHLFFDQNQMWRVVRNFTTPPNTDFLQFPNNGGENIHSQRRGNLDMHGWTLRLEFDF